MNFLRCLAVVQAFAAMSVAFSAAAQPIVLGELNSYKQFPGFLEPYKKGMEKAMYQQTFDKFVARRLRELCRIPRLSLFFMD